MGNASLTNDTDALEYTFTWTPTQIISRPVVFVAIDNMGASSVYEPMVQFCECLNGGECTLHGELDQLANPVDLNCICSAGITKLIAIVTVQ